MNLWNWACDCSADAVHSSEHHHLRGLQEPVVNVTTSARPHPAQREGKGHAHTHTHLISQHHLCVYSLRVCLGVLQYFADLRNSIVNSQPPEKQQAMHLCFENLMEGIERNLLTKNRDRLVTLSLQTQIRCVINGVQLSSIWYLELYTVSHSSHCSSMLQKERPVFNAYVKNQSKSTWSD